MGTYSTARPSGRNVWKIRSLSLREQHSKEGHISIRVRWWKEWSKERLGIQEILLMPDSEF